jgi:HK97 family phage prohead protease
MELRALSSEDKSAAKKAKKRDGGEDIERRFFNGELRAQGEGDDRRIIGYAAVFNSLSEDLGGWKEMIEPGAFTDTILVDDVRGLYNHQPTMVLGRNRAGTLILVEDEVGLRYEIIPPDTSYARDLLVSIDRGDVNQSSFGFAVPRGGDVWIDPTESQPFPIRKVRKAKLFDVSPATFPAYPVTSVAVRDMAAQLLASAGRATGKDADSERTARRLARMKRQLELVERL